MMYDQTFYTNAEIEKNNGCAEQELYSCSNGANGALGRVE